MMIRIEIVVMPKNGYRTPAGSHISINDIPVNEPDKKWEVGLCDAVFDLFRGLDEEGVQELLAKCDLRKDILRGERNPSFDINDIVLIDPCRFLKNGDYHSEGALSAKLFGKVRRALALITWRESRHFIDRTHSLRSCIVCGNSQRRTAGKPLDWPSEHCLNISCPSHMIERMIDRAYKIPSAAREIEWAIEKHLEGLGKHPQKLRPFALLSKSGK